MSAYDPRTKLEALRDQFETFGKGANYLLVAHSAGLVGCLAVVKEHPNGLPEPLHGVRLLIFLFGLGLILGTVFWAASMATKISVTQQIISQEPYSQKWLSWLGRKIVQYTALLGLWGSLLVFVGAIGLIMSQFVDALPFEYLKTSYWWPMRG